MDQPTTHFPSVPLTLELRQEGLEARLNKLLHILLLNTLMYRSIQFVLFFFLGMEAQASCKRRAAPPAETQQCSVLDILTPAVSFGLCPPGSVPKGEHVDLESIVGF